MCLAQIPYLIPCVSQPLGAIVKALALVADEGIERLKTNFMSWKKKSTSVPEMSKFRPNPSYYEGQILSLFINTDKKVTETFQLIDFRTWL